MSKEYGLDELDVLGITEEDLTEAGVVDTEPTEKKPDAEPEPNNPPAVEEKLDGEDGEPAAEPAAEPDKPDTAKPNKGGNIGVALAEERARRKAAEAQFESMKREMERLRQQAIGYSVAPNQPQPAQTIAEFAKQQALQQLQITNPEELIYTDPAKYEQYVSTKAKIEYQVEQQELQRQQQVSQNVAFINELRVAHPNLDVLIAYGSELLQGMTMQEAIPIDAAYTRIGQGVGTQQDFEIIRKFAADCASKMVAPSTPQDSDPLAMAQTLPKAGALKGAQGSQPGMTWERAFELFEAGNLEDIPADMREQIERI